MHAQVNNKRQRKVMSYETKSEGALSQTERYVYQLRCYIKRHRLYHYYTTDTILEWKKLWQYLLHKKAS